jgi:KaiC/GvpD/RAD55 family RecA-like ATPase
VGDFYLRPDEGKTEPAITPRNPIFEGILNGELLSGSSIALIGAPGTGTSMLATQHVVNALRRGRRVVLTLLDHAPPLAYKYFKLLGFDAQPFLADGRLQIIDEYGFLRKLMGISTITDISNLRPLSFQEISKAFEDGFTRKILGSEGGPYTIVNDSLTSLSPFIDVHTLYQILATNFELVKRKKHSSLVVAHEGVLESNFVQTLTRFVDGVVRLKMHWSPRRLAREIYVEKMRLTNIEVPSADFTISESGIMLNYESSQIIAQHSHNVELPEARRAKLIPSSEGERTSTGIQALDTILGGGIPKGTFVCLQGDVGTGTSTFCTQFAWARLLSGGRVSYYCVDESPDMVTNQFESFGWNIGPYLKDKNMVLSDAYDLFRVGRLAAIGGAKDFSGLRKLIGEFLKVEEAKMSPRKTPLVAVIDSFTTMAPYLDLKTAYVLAHLIADDARISEQTYLAVVHSGTVEANLLYACLGAADGIIRLENNWKRGRTGSSSSRRLVRKMRIEKMAFTPTPTYPIEYEISSKGIQLLPGEESLKENQDTK